jgi:hypothetical protein
VADAMQVGFRTVDGVRVRCAESTGTSAPSNLLTSLWPESVYAFAPIWPSLGERRSPGGRGRSGLRTIRAPGRPPVASRDQQVARPVRSRPGARETACRRVGHWRFCRPVRGHLTPWPSVEHGGGKRRGGRPNSAQRSAGGVGARSRPEWFPCNRSAGDRRRGSRDDRGLSAAAGGPRRRSRAFRRRSEPRSTPP